MKVKIKDLKPNPFRRLKTYPISEEKVERLRQSIKHTGFWDNIVGRQKDGKVEIAYGHHRLIALQKEYSKDYEVDVIVKPLDDARMIQVMADENDSLYEINPAIINETVKVARDYLREHPEEATAEKGRETTKEDWERIRIKNFLNWTEHKVHEALAAINDIEENYFNKEIYEAFQNVGRAELWRTAYKKYAVEQKLVSRNVGNRIARDVQKGNLATNQIRSEFIREIRRKGKKTQKERRFLDSLMDLTSEIWSIRTKIKEVVKQKERMVGTGEGFDFLKACKSLYITLQELGGGKNEQARIRRQN